MTQIIHPGSGSATLPKSRFTNSVQFYIYRDDEHNFLQAPPSRSRRSTIHSDLPDGWLVPPPPMNPPLQSPRPGANRQRRRARTPPGIRIRTWARSPSLPPPQPHTTHSEQLPAFLYLLTWVKICLFIVIFCTILFRCRNTALVQTTQSLSWNEMFLLLSRESFSVMVDGFGYDA
jgi:hypothetical protein